MSDNNQQETWWSRPCGGGEVLRLALPLVISTGSWSLMHFVDRVFLFWHSKAEMSAAMPAGILFWTLTCFFIGVSSYVNTFVAQYYGAKRQERIGAALGQGILFGLAIAPLFLLLIPFCPAIFRLAGHDEATVTLEAAYLRIALVGTSANVIGSVQSAFFTGRGLTRVVMIVDLLANLLNCGLDYLLIFGKWGLPEFGIHGAAWATVASQFFKVAMLASLMACDPERTACGLRNLWRLDWELMRRLLWFGGPSGLQLLAEAGAFSLMVLYIGAIGGEALAATTLALTINNVAFVPMVGVHIAVSTIVGQQLGAGRPDLAARATWSALVLALLYTSVFAVAYVGFPEQFLAIHERGADPGEFAAVKPSVIFLLHFVAAYCLFDSMQLVFVGAIKGAGDTMFVLLTTATSGSAMVLAGRLGEDRFMDPLTWWWTVASAWVFYLALVYGLRFLRGKWKTMRVIERAE